MSSLPLFSAAAVVSPDFCTFHHLALSGMVAVSQQVSLYPSDGDMRCTLFGRPERPAFCGGLASIRRNVRQLVGIRFVMAEQLGADNTSQGLPVDWVELAA